MSTVVAGYLGVPLQFIIGLVLVVAFIFTPQAGAMRPTFIFVGLALMVCSVGLWMATRQVHQELRVRRRALSSY